MAKFGLGKGLGALIPEHQHYFEQTQAEKDQAATVRMVPIEALSPNPDQPRRSFPEDSLEELAESIRRHGLLQPLIVHESSPDKYVIIAGERRYRAARIAGLLELPVIVSNQQHDRHLEISLVENIQRENLNPIEEAQAYLRLMELTGATQDAIAAMVGKSRATVANAIRLLKLPEDMQEAVKQGRISPGHARSLLSIEDPLARQRLYQAIIDGNLSVREAEAKAQQLLTGSESSRTKRQPPRSQTSDHVSDTLDPALRALRDKLIELFGTKVEVSGTQESGTIKIHYFSLDDLQRIYEVLHIEE